MWIFNGDGRINRGRGRVIPKQISEGVKVHRTVEMRKKLYKEEKDDKPYNPRAKFVQGANIIPVA